MRGVSPQRMLVNWGLITGSAYALTSKYRRKNGIIL